MTVSKVKNMLRRMFDTKNFVYESRLLHRMMEKARKDSTGGDPHSFTKFFELGCDIRSNDGLFEWEVCPVSTRLVSWHCQTKLEAELAATYSPYLSFFDMTANASTYDMKAAPPVGIDALGKNCPFGVGMVEGESGHDMGRTLDLFGLSHPDASCGVDEAVGWIQPAEERSLRLFHDTFHISVNTLKKKGGLGGLAKVSTHVIAILSCILSQSPNPALSLH